VAAAGGFSRRADRGDITVVRNGTTAQLSARDAYYPEPGDQVVVPFRVRRTALERVQAYSTIAGAISGSLLTVLALLGALPN
jgi:protein involved in polysaccharide export with SLBB domain